MGVYAAAYRTTVPKLVSQRTELYPEAVMWAHLAAHGGAQRMRQLAPFNATLARPRRPGRPFHDDPFGKIRLDSAERAGGGLPLPPSNACMAAVQKLIGRGGDRRRLHPPRRHWLRGMLH